MPLPDPQLQLDALTALVREVSSQRHVGDVLGVALRQCLDLTGSQFGFVGLTHDGERDHPDHVLEIAAIHGFHPARTFYERHRVMPLRPNLFGRVVLENRPVRTSDAAADPRRSGQPDGHPRVETFLGIPLSLDGEVIGMVGLANRTGPYLDEHERVATTYASLIAVLLHKAQLYEQLQRANDTLGVLVAERTRELAQARDELADKAARLQEVLAETVDAAERERRRIAEDIHDGINQLLIGAMLELTSGQHRLAAGQPESADTALASARDILAAVETEIRRVVYDLHPPVLDGLGLPAAIRDVADRFSAFTHLDCRVEVTGRPVRLAGQAEIALYRIVQEALQNVAVHAHAREVNLRLDFDDQEERVSVTISDDGRGFDPGGVERSRHGDGRRHLGLESMRRRVESLAGRWTVTSNAAGGTRVHACVPAAVARPADAVVGQGAQGRGGGDR